MIDGTIARKLSAVSKFGARLDTASDFVFMMVCCVKILHIMSIPTLLWWWIFIILLIKIFSVVLVFIYKKKLISIHSVLNKITGFALFLFPLSLFLVNINFSVVVICALATIAAIHEIYFITKGEDVLL